MRPYDFPGRIAVDSLGAGVPISHGAIGVEHEDRVIGHSLHQQPEPLFADPQPGVSLRHLPRALFDPLLEQFR